MRRIFKENHASALKIVSLFHSYDKPNLSLFANDDDIIMALMALKDELMDEVIDKFFYKIEKEWKFVDHGMVKAVVDGSECKAAIQLVKNFTEKINKMLICDFHSMENIIDEENSTVWIPKENTRVLKVECKLEKVDVKKWGLLRQALNSCFNFPEGTLQFDHSTTLDGITLICKISSQAKDYLLNLKITKGRLKHLADEGITCLKIDDEYSLKVSLECNTEVCNTI